MSRQKPSHASVSVCSRSTITYPAPRKPSKAGAGAGPIPRLRRFGKPAAKGTLFGTYFTALHIEWCGLP
jgi:hypothetical protein